VVCDSCKGQRFSSVTIIWIKLDTLQNVQGVSFYLFASGGRTTSTERAIHLLSQRSVAGSWKERVNLGSTYPPSNWQTTLLPHRHSFGWTVDLERFSWMLPSVLLHFVLTLLLQCKYSKSPFCSHRRAGWNCISCLL